MPIFITDMLHHSHKETHLIATVSMHRKYHIVQKLDRVQLCQMVCAQKFDDYNFDELIVGFIGKEKFGKENFDEFLAIRQIRLYFSPLQFCTYPIHTLWKSLSLSDQLIRWLIKPWSSY